METFEQRLPLLKYNVKTEHHKKSAFAGLGVLFLLQYPLGDFVDTGKLSC